MSTFEKICIGLVILVGLATIIAGAYFLFSGESSDRKITAQSKLTTAKAENKSPEIKSTSVKNAPAIKPVVEEPPKESLFGTIRGQVLEKDTSAPIEGAVVEINALSKNGTKEARVNTDSSGEFAIPNLEGGVTYFIAVSKNKFATFTKGDVVVQAGNVLDVGTIFLETGVGAEIFVVGKDNKPIESAEITINKPERVQGRTERMIPLGQKFLTDPNGRAQVTNLANGGYRFDVSKEGFVSSNNNILMIRGGKPDLTNYKIVLVKKAK